MAECSVLAECSEGDRPPSSPPWSAGKERKREGGRLRRGAWEREGTGVEDLVIFLP